MTLDVAHSADITGVALTGLFGDAVVIGIGKRLGVVANELLFRKSDQCAKSLVGGDDLIVQIIGPCFLRTQEKSLFGVESRQFGLFSFTITPYRSHLRGP